MSQTNEQIDEHHICVNCHTVYAEYVNGCPRCWDKYEKPYAVVPVKAFISSLRLSTIQEVEEKTKQLWADEFNGDYTEEEKKNPLVAYNAALQQVKQVLASMRKGEI